MGDRTSCCKCGCVLPQSDSEHDLAAGEYDITDRLPPNNFFMRFEIIGNDDWSVRLELVDRDTDTVVDTATFTQGVAVPVDEAYRNIRETSEVAEHRATIESEIESSSSDVVVSAGEVPLGT
ncbi:MAG: hypothetical protein AAFX06_21745, partial [Planctomycetota bacterium]